MGSATKIRQVGNSAGLTLKKTDLSAAGLEVGDQVILEAGDETITVRKADNTHSRAMAALEVGIDRYSRTLTELSK